MAARLISPKHPVKIAWDSLIMLLTVWASIAIPLRIVYGTMSYVDNRAVEIVITLLFAADVVLGFYTALSLAGRENHDKKSVRRSYLKGWFAVDLAAAFPMVQLTALLFPGSRHSIMALQLIRIVKLARLPHFLQTHPMHFIGDTTFKLATFLFGFLLTAHFVTCGWLLLDGIDPAKFQGWEQYLRGIYWTITTLATVGYGDITPQTSPQILFCVGVMILGISIYGYLIGNVTSILSNINVAKTLHLKQLDRINAFTRQHNIPLVLAERIANYQEYLWESRMGYDESEVVGQLPKDLRTDVLMHMHREIIQKVPLFKGVSENIIREIVLELRPIVTTPGEFIFQKGDEGAEMYFIRRGSVQILSSDLKTIFATLTEGSFFGEVALLLKQTRNASARASDYCDLYILPRTGFERVAYRYPDFHAQIQQMAAQRTGEQK